jgi:hypothetical protein
MVKVVEETVDWLEREMKLPSEVEMEQPRMLDIPAWYSGRMAG